jgi:hypothetical protein
VVLMHSVEDAFVNPLFTDPRFDRAKWRLGRRSESLSANIAMS